MAIQKPILSFVLFSIVLFLLCMFMFTQSASGDQEQLKEMFKKADIIPDGKLDQGEFDIYHYTSFSLIDLDKDDLLMEEECEEDCFKWMFLKITGRKKDEGAEYRQHEFQNTPYRFEAIDMDGSGALNVYEYILFGRDRFPYFDLDQDGFIQESEFCSAYQSSMPCDYLAKDLPIKFNNEEKED